ncbi:MAG: hypothetical protein HC880_22040 [Bacteroidia bacterium]|nr:hypothetical protein [Bacteroidia bacterium]
MLLSDNTQADDYFDLHTGTYLGTDGLGNGIRLTTKSLLTQVQVIREGGEITLLGRQGVMSRTLATYAARRRISDVVAIHLANYYFPLL